MTVVANIRPYIAEIREWRKAHALTAAAFGDMVGCSACALYQYEGLRKVPNEKVRTAIIAAVGLPDEVVFPEWQNILVKQHYFRGVDVELDQERMVKIAEAKYAMALPTPKNQDPAETAGGYELGPGTIDDLLRKLTSRERRVLSLRFGLNGGEGMTLGECGNQLGVSGERIRQIETKALRRLRRPAVKRGLRDYLA